MLTSHWSSKELPERPKPQPETARQMASFIDGSDRNFPIKDVETSAATGVVASLALTERGADFFFKKTGGTGDQTERILSDEVPIQERSQADRIGVRAVSSAPSGIEIMKHNTAT